MPDHHQAPPRTPRTGRAVEQARYRISAGERVVLGQRINGQPCLIDTPAQDEGRVYLIERDLCSVAELEAIVADYVAVAERLDAVPMARTPVDAAEPAR